MVLDQILVCYDNTLRDAEIKIQYFLTGIMHQSLG